MDYSLWLDCTLGGRFLVMDAVQSLKFKVQPVTHHASRITDCLCSLVFGSWQLAVGCLLLAVGSWQLAFGCLLLAFGWLSKS